MRRDGSGVRAMRNLRRASVSEGACDGRRDILRRALPGLRAKVFDRLGWRAGNDKRGTGEFVLTKLSLAELCEGARLNPRQYAPPPPPPPFDHQFVLDLLAMRKDAVFERLWIDAGIVRVQIMGALPTKLCDRDAREMIRLWKGLPKAEPKKTTGEGSPRYGRVRRAA